MPVRCNGTGIIGFCSFSIHSFKIFVWKYWSLGGVFFWETVFFYVRDYDVEEDDESAFKVVEINPDW